MCFIAIVLLVNIVFHLVSERFSLRLDLTPEKLFVIGEETKAYLDTLREDVRIYVLSRESVFSGDDMFYYTQANETIKQFVSYSPHLSIHYVDLVRSPNFNTRYPQFQLSDQTIIIESPDRAITITFQDMFNTERTYDTYYQPVDLIISSKAEQVLANALIRLLADKQVTVAILDGFGEHPATALEELLIANQYNISRLNLLVDSIHEDVDALVICSPNRDYTDDTLRKLDAFLFNDGKYGKLLFYFTEGRYTPTPNIDVFLSDWGISTDDGIAFQTESRYLIKNNNYWSAAIYSESVYAKETIGNQLVTIMPETRPLTVLFDTKDNKSVTELLSFGDTVYIQPTDSLENPGISDSLRQGPFPVMLLSRHFYSREGEFRVSAIVVSGSRLMIDEELLSASQLGNSRYILSLFASLTPHPPGFATLPKSTGHNSLPISQYETILLSVIFILLVPLVIIISGIVVFFRTRYL